MHNYDLQLLTPLETRSDDRYVPACSTNSIAMTKQISNLLIMIGVDHNELYYGRYVVQISSLLLVMGIDHSSGL